MALGPERRGVLLPGAGSGSLRRRRLAWAVLLALLVALLGGAVTFDPRAVGGVPVGDSATYWMQAASLAHDLDLTYGSRDVERFRAAWGASPEGLRLRSRDAGDHIAFDVPAPYAVALAPLVRLAPVRGAAVTNVLLLALAALAAAAVLERRLGPAAALWVAAFVFGSVVFAYAFRVGPDLFVLAAVVGAYALAYRGEGPVSARLTEVYSGSLPGEESGRGVGRWLGAGALLALAAAYHPAYLLLAVPLFRAAPLGGRRRATALLALSLVVVLSLAAVAGWAAGDDWLPWSERGRVFLSETGFPAVDTPVAAWPKEAADAGDGAVASGPLWLPGGPPEPVWDAGLWGWNLLFLAVGRSVGLLPYFLPLLLALSALPLRESRGRLAIPWAVAAALAVWLAVRPFDFAGDLGGPGDHWFLPLYGALWFVAARPVRPVWALVVALAAAPFLYPSWLAPRTVAQPAALRAGSFVSPVARRFLPQASTQRDLPGVREAQIGVLWVRAASPGLTIPSRGERLIVDTGQPGELWIGSPVPVTALRLAFGAGAPTRVELSDAKLLRTTLTPAGGVVLTVDPGAPDRTHPLWWTRGDVFLYRVGFAFPAGSSSGGTDGAEAGREARQVTLQIVPEYQQEKP